jgi:hypothetical protein
VSGVVAGSSAASSRRRWTLRVLAAVGSWAVLTLVARVFGNQPRAGLLALVVAALATVLWLYLDASVQSDVPVWDRVADEPIRPPGEDPRLALLTRVVAQHFDARRPDGTLRRHLLDLADHRLVSRHGLSWRADPERAEGVMGPELTALARQSEPYPRMSEDQIDVLLKRIEGL